LLDAGKAAGQYKRPNPNHVFDIVRSELGGLYAGDLTASLSQCELGDCAILNIFRDETEAIEIAAPKVGRGRSGGTPIKLIWRADRAGHLLQGEKATPPHYFPFVVQFTS
jgi:hypothetical protein